VFAGGKRVGVISPQKRALILNHVRREKRQGRTCVRCVDSSEGEN